MQKAGQFAKTNICRTQGRQKLTYVKKHRDFGYNVGDLVLIKDQNGTQDLSPKLRFKIVGLYMIID